MDEIKKFIRTRAGHRGHVTKIIAQFEGGTKTARLTREELLAKKDILGKLTSEILNLLDDDQDVENEIIEHGEFESKIYQCLHKTEDIMEKKVNTTDQRVKSSEVDNPKLENRVRLPKLNLKVFNGRLHEWMPFWQMYYSTIHNSIELTGVEKFNYLVSYLSGEALASVQGFALTEENYAKAIEVLKARFGDTRHIISDHMMRLSSVRPVLTLDYKYLKSFYDYVQVQVRALESLNVSSENYSALLIPQLLQKLPDKIRISVAKIEKGGNPLNIQDLLRTLYDEISHRQSGSKLVSDYVSSNKLPRPNYLPSNNKHHRFENYGRGHLNNELNGIGHYSKDVVPGHKNNNRNHPTPSHSYTTQTSLSCFFCGLNHHAANCQKFKSHESRKEVIRNKKLCYICLRTGHNSSDCTKTCRGCGGRHHLAICRIHMDKQMTNKLANKQISNDDRPETNIVTHNNVFEGVEDILLQTAKIKCKRNEIEMDINVLFDKGSHRSYVTEDLFDNLNLIEIGVERCNISTFGSEEFRQTRCKQTILPVMSLAGILRIPALTVPTICKMVNQKCDILRCPNARGLDCNNANICGKIDLLIGLDNYWDIVTGEVRKKYHGAVAMNSLFGWLISGKQLPANLSMLCTRCEDEFLDIGESNTFDDNEEDMQKMLTQFESTLKFDGDRYCVDLPWREGLHLKGTNFPMAMVRLNSLVSRLQADGNMERYDEQLQIYEDKGYIERVPMTKLIDCWYLPHHAVIREDKATTKLRIVFDGSSKMKNGTSLNDCLYKGPALLTDVNPQLMLFRMSKIIAISDIEEAFLQISISEGDRDYIRFIWRRNGELYIYRFCRLPFGLTCSPFLLSATLRFHLRRYDVENDGLFYVDDWTMAINSPTEGEQKIRKITEIMAKGGFNLRKWDSNNRLILPDKIDLPERRTVLGLDWRVEEDTLQICNSVVVQEYNDKPITKRTVLSTLASNFDPLGLFLCVTILFRLFFQGLNALSWDEVLTADQKCRFAELVDEFRKVSFMKIPRWTGYSEESCPELHIFADASKKAYGACAYIRYWNKGHYQCTLIRSRGKVNSNTGTTIPRLELAAAVMGARLYDSLRKSYQGFQNIPVVLWSDSTTTLNWIIGKGQWPVYVENRVAIIRNFNLTGNWRYVNTTQNPADLLSRGLLSKDLVDKNSLWWSGPNFLWSDLPYNELQEYCSISTTALILKSNNTTVADKLITIENFSNYDKLCRVLAYVYRFVVNMKSTISKESKRSGPLQLKEVRVASIEWLKIEQLKFFPNEVKRLKSGKPVKGESTIRRLDVSLNDTGLIEVGTRLLNSTFVISPRRPVLLPTKSWITSLIIWKYHIEGLHVGVSQTLANLRTRFWIIHGRREVRAVISKCVHCKRLEGQHYTLPHSPPLPEFRVSRTLPFTNIGIDFAGPLTVKTNLSARNGTFSKAYICLFTCATTRAIHLEITLDLSCDSFIYAFRRFIGRRGVPSYIYSDNGTTFQSASKRIARFINGIRNDHNVIDLCTKKEIAWGFITPKASWWGGFYERMIGVTKRCLKKVVGNTSLSYFELETILIEVEATVNDRPLTYINEEINEQESISPSLLILGRKHCENQLTSNTDSTVNTLIYRRKYQKLLMHHFWKAFYRDYLLALREQYTKVQHGTDYEIKKGDVVHIYDEGPRLQWRIGLVDELIHGRDMKVRAARIRLPITGRNRGFLTRAINHLYPLEVRSSSSDSPTAQRHCKSKNKVVNVMMCCLFIFGCMIPYSNATSSVFSLTNQTNPLLFCETPNEAKLLLQPPSTCSLVCDRNDRPGSTHISIPLDVYSKRQTIQIKAYICHRVKTLCKTFKNLLWQTSEKCENSDVWLPPSSCKSWMTTKNTDDGELTGYTPHSLSTMNKMRLTYYLLATTEIEIFNSFLYEEHLSFVVMNQKYILDDERAVEPCELSMGRCNLIGHRNAQWDTSYCPFEYIKTTNCHKGPDLQLVCPSEDFDLTDISHNSPHCNATFHFTKQGLYLVGDMAKLKTPFQHLPKSLENKQHHGLIYAKLQNIADKVFDIEYFVNCLADYLTCRVNSIDYVNLLNTATTNWQYNRVSQAMILKRGHVLFHKKCEPVFAYRLFFDGCFNRAEVITTFKGRFVGYVTPFTDRIVINNRSKCEEPTVYLANMVVYTKKETIVQRAIGQKTPKLTLMMSRLIENDFRDRSTLLAKHMLDAEYLLESDVTKISEPFNRIQNEAGSWFHDLLMYPGKIVMICVSLSIVLLTIFVLYKFRSIISRNLRLYIRNFKQKQASSNVQSLPLQTVDIQHLPTRSVLSLPSTPVNTEGGVIQRVTSISGTSRRERVENPILC